MYCYYRAPHNWFAWRPVRFQPHPQIPARWVWWRWLRRSGYVINGCAVGWHYEAIV